MKELVINKVLSGRFLLTVTCAVVFAYIACKGMLEVAAVTSILSSVFTAYFGRNDRAAETKPAAGTGTGGA